MKSPCPPLPLPQPLRGAEIGTFAHRTITVRLPNIARQTLADNSHSRSERPLPAAALDGIEALIAEIPNEPVVPIKDAGAPDEADWERYVQPYLGQDWLQIPWYFAEMYFYRRIIAASGYFQPGPGQGVDPYAIQKRLGLESGGEVYQALEIWQGGWLDASSAGSGAQEALVRLFHLDLWGNQADLSLFGVGGNERLGYQDVHSQRSKLLVDDAPAVVSYLSGLPSPRRIDFIPDNAGLELVFDLMAADYFLKSGAAEQVVFHLKAHPTYVSDAIIADIPATNEFLSASPLPQVSALGERLRRAVEDGRLRLTSHFYWHSPLPIWDLPSGLRRDLSGASLLISKGDANYRRLLGDLHWPPTAPFGEIVCSLPAPLVSLRVLKSELVVGLQPDQVESADQQDPDWLVDGKWGQIQFTRKTS
jgi:hypothetical protein